MLERLTQEQLIEKFNSMIHSVTRKYTNYVEYEDLYQECCIAIIEAYDKYDSTKGAKLESYMYNVIDWKCKNLVRTNKKHIDTISLQLLANTDHSGDAPVTLEDTLANDIDIEADIVDREMLKFYEAEIRRSLPKDQADVLVYKYFRGYFGIDRYKLWRAKRNLIRKSYVFREEYRKIKGLPSEITIY